MDESLVLFIYQISSAIAAIVFIFNKILTLKNDNKLSFYSLNRIFALSFLYKTKMNISAKGN